MKKTIATLLLFLAAGATPALAQGTYAPPAPQYAEAWSVEDLDNLIAPIALYPDPLLAQILPATTEPEQIALCAQYLRAGRGLDEIDAQPWDDSVKALARYPDVLYWLDSRPDWTRDVGDAFASDPNEVMNSVQQMRARAMAAGNLVATPEEQVTMEGGMIVILPADPDVICMPIYDPEIVYMPRTVEIVGPVIRFGPRFHRGVWERHEIDWGRRAVWVNHDGWRHGAELRVDVRTPVWRARANRPDYGRHAAIARQPARPEYRGYPPQPRTFAPARPIERPREEPRPVVVPRHEEHPVVAPPREERPREERPREEPHPVVAPRHEEHPVAPPREEHRVAPPQPQPQPRVAPTPRGPIGAIDRGTATRAASSRGQQSRQVAQPRPAPAPAQGHPGQH